MKIVDLTNNNEVIVKVDTEIGYKLALNPQIKGMFVYEDGNTYVALFNDGDTNWIEDAKTLDLACQWLTGKIDSTELYEKNEEVTKMKNNKDITILNKNTDGKRNVTYKLKLDTIKAPVKIGDKVGKIEVIENDQIIMEIIATVDANIKKANIFTIYLRDLKDIISGMI